MNMTELLEDGSVVARALTAPEHGLSRAVERRRAGAALAIATLASLLSAAAVVPRIDYEGAAAAALDERPRAGPEEDELTPYQREEALARARKIGTLAGWVAAGLQPAAFAVVAAAFLFLGFRVAGTRPGYRETLSVAAHGMLPVWLSGLLAIPAAVVRAPIPPPDVPRLLPTSLAAFVPAASPPLVAALSSVELFSAWAVVLVATGMSRASGASRRRALAVTVVLFLAYVALLKVVPAALAAAGAGGPGGPRGGP